MGNMITITFDQHDDMHYRLKEIFDEIVELRDSIGEGDYDEGEYDPVDERDRATEEVKKLLEEVACLFEEELEEEIKKQFG